MDENPRRSDRLRVQGARFDDVIDFGDSYACRRSERRIKIPRRAAIDQVAMSIGFMSTDKSEIRPQSSF